MFNMSQLDVLIDLSEDVKQLKVSSHFVPVSDEMSPRIKCSSSVKKKCVFNSEDELTPRLPKDFSHCSAGINQFISALPSRLRDCTLIFFIVI